MSRYPLFDRSKLQLRSLQERGHELLPSDCWPLSRRFDPDRNPDLRTLAERIVAARRCQRPVILMMGAHPIKLGLSRYLIDLMERGIVTHVATNGAGLIHDFELALGSGTSEDVAKWIQQGQFGMWVETGRLNEIVLQGAARGEGFGEAVGRTIETHAFPDRDLSLAAAGWRLRIPVTSHVSIGSDIIHAHPDCGGAALGQVSYTDFLMFAESIRQLEGGVFLNVGSAVTGPEVYLKALSMARNVARQAGENITDFTTAVFDLVPLPDDYRQGPPSREHSLYYYRPWKTILVRTVADGGTSFYLCGDHRQTLPSLWHHCVTRLESAQAPHAA